MEFTLSLRYSQTQSACFIPLTGGCENPSWLWLSSVSASYTPEVLEEAEEDGPLDEDAPLEGDEPRSEVAAGLGLDFWKRKFLSEDPPEPEVEGAAAAGGGAGAGADGSLMVKASFREPSMKGLGVFLGVEEVVRVEVGVGGEGVEGVEGLALVAASFSSLSLLSPLFSSLCLFLLQIRVATRGGEEKSRREKRVFLILERGFFKRFIGENVHFISLHLSKRNRSEDTLNYNPKLFLSPPSLVFLASFLPFPQLPSPLFCRQLRPQRRKENLRKLPKRGRQDNKTPLKEKSPQDNATTLD